MMEELHTDSIDGGHEGQLWARSRARERAYSNNLNYSYSRISTVLEPSQVINVKITPISIEFLPL
jgi:hypothetical protein